MDNRERQRQDSEVIIVWCLLGLGGVVMVMLLFDVVVDVVDNVILGS